MYYAATVKKEICDACGACIISCPEANALKMVEMDGGVQVVEVCVERCKGCGLCVEACPQKAMDIAAR